MSARPTVGSGRAGAGPLDVLWQGSVILWTLLAGEAVAAIVALAPGRDGDDLAYFGLASLAVQWSSLTTLGLLWLGRERLATAPPQKVARYALAVFLLSAWAVGGVGWWLLHEAWGLAADAWPELMLRLTGIALAAGLLALAAFQNHWRARQAALRAKQAELEALEARIRPHFLFNTLNTGAALVHARPGEAERLLLDLADLFRAALGGAREIPLADELALARRYLEIEALRFGPRLTVSWDLPPTLPEVDVPALSIQPLVENAIRHGVEPAAHGGRVDIAVVVSADVVRIVVRNDLPGPGAVPAPGHQVGLTSARERIGALSGGRGRLDTRVEDGRYVAAITLPTAPR
jgi:two-component system sensor histidine kinase AlgZ